MTPPRPTEVATAGALVTASGAPYEHVYLHVPFCARRCSYCDFSIAVRRTIPVDAFVEAVTQELMVRFGEPASPPTTPRIETLYFGGGTPSRLGGAGIARLIDVVRRHAIVDEGAEVTVEANPEDLTAETVATWSASGVTRISLGVQSFDPAVLGWMHRTHDVGAVHAAARAIADGGIANWSLDLIYALPPEVERDWERDLDSAIALAPSHLSAYGLTVEGGTPLSRWRERGEVREASEERYERDFLLAHDRLKAAGYRHYEVSNWGRPSLESRHNSSYWRGVPYLGVGPAAHGYDGVTRRWNAREFARWLQRTTGGGDPIEGSERLTASQHALETLYVGLRTLQGVALRDSDAPLVDRWIAEGWGERVGGRLVLTPHGWLRLDALVAALTEHRSRY